MCVLRASIQADPQGIEGDWLMKWFKHDANASRDAKLKKLVIRYGMEGYGLYWYCLELIADKVDRHSLTFDLEHDADIIAHDTRLHPDQVEEMMRYMVDLALFENNDGVITCFKLAKRLEENLSKSPEFKLIKDSIKELIPVSNRLNTGEIPVSQRTEENRTEENRKEKKRRDSQENKFSDADLQVAQTIFELIKVINPSHKEPTFETWANDIRLMRERDKRTHEQILDLFRYANNDDFWKVNILCPKTLRGKWDKLTIQKTNSRNKKTSEFAGML